MKAILVIDMPNEINENYLEMKNDKKSLQENRKFEHEF